MEHKTPPISLWACKIMYIPLTVFKAATRLSAVKCSLRFAANLGSENAFFRQRIHLSSGIQPFVVHVPPDVISLKRFIFYVDLRQLYTVYNLHLK
jgi:hypothetical protein